MDFNTLILIDIAVTIVLTVAFGLWLRREMWDSNDRMSAQLTNEMALGLEARGEEEAAKLNFDKVIGVFVEMSDTAKATFIYRLVAVMEPDHMETTERYIKSKRQKKLERKH